MIGGEGPANAAWMVAGTWIKANQMTCTIFDLLSLKKLIKSKLNYFVTLRNLREFVLTFTSKQNMNVLH